MLLLACGGGGGIVLLGVLGLVLGVLGILLMGFKMAGYFIEARALARVHPELCGETSRLLLARMVIGACAFAAASGLAIAFGWPAGLAALAAARFGGWMCYGHFHIAPYVPLTGSELLAWSTAGTVWTFLIEVMFVGGVFAVGTMLIR